MSETDEQAQLRELRTTLGDAEFASFVEDFHLDARQRLARLRRGLAAGDPEGSREEAHALRGSALAVGSALLAEACRGVEAACRAEDVARAQALVPGVEAALGHTRDRLDRALSDGPGGS
ncbi:Hpt domain-containing protein [Nocardioides sp. GCM10027113]|uniref:Hpt domain-containing protein n=1 Tax=unclassified Nocardioides TaxID=2615069 RepID=UPI00361A28EF